MTANKETAVFREEFGEDFPDLTELAAKVSQLQFSWKFWSVRPRS